MNTTYRIKLKDSKTEIEVEGTQAWTVATFETLRKKYAKYYSEGDKDKLL